MLFLLMCLYKYPYIRLRILARNLHYSYQLKISSSGSQEMKLIPNPKIPMAAYDLSKIKIGLSGLFLYFMEKLRIFCMISKKSSLTT